MTLHFFSAAFRPAGEADRQRAVDDLMPVAPDDTELQALLGEVCTVLRTPVALLTLTDGDHQRVVSAIGIGRDEISRARSFCAHTIVTSDGVLSVPDLRTDPRFRANPMVVGEAGLRHYTGVAVVSGIHRLGALCGLDVRPHGPASFAQRRALRRLADMAAARMGAMPRLE